MQRLIHDRFTERIGARSDAALGTLLWEMVRDTPTDAMKENVQAA